MSEKYIVNVEQTVVFTTRILVDAKNGRHAAKRALKVTPKLAEDAWEVSDFDYDVTDIYSVKPGAQMVRLVKAGK